MQTSPDLENRTAQPTHPARRWCDLDGEFLTFDGFTRLRCSRCARSAVLLVEDAAHCTDHLPTGVTLPGWLLALAPRICTGSPHPASDLRTGQGLRQMDVLPNC